MDYKQSGIPVIRLGQWDGKLRAQSTQYGLIDALYLPLIEQELICRIAATLHYRQFFQAVELSTEQNNRTLPSLPSTLQSKEKQLIFDACNLLKRKSSEDWTLEALALALATNRSTLALVFKKGLGLGVFTWFRNYRLSKAKKLLEHSTISIQDIATEVGFGSSANFSTAFKKAFHVTPRQIRQEMTETKKVVTQTKGKFQKLSSL